jgi:hypothetical protein
VKSTLLRSVRKLSAIRAVVGFSNDNNRNSDGDNNDNDDDSNGSSDDDSDSSNGYSDDDNSNNDKE